MVGCSVLGCKSRSERKLHEITFHLFPSNPEIKIKWLEATGRNNWHPTKFSRICSLHFNGASFVYKGKKVQLKPYSVPEKCIHKMSDKRKLYKCDKCIRTYRTSAQITSQLQKLHFSGKTFKVYPT